MQSTILFGGADVPSVLELFCVRYPSRLRLSRLGELDRISDNSLNREGKKKYRVPWAPVAYYFSGRCQSGPFVSQPIVVGAEVRLRTDPDRRPCLVSQSVRLAPH
jgi:hypothetical protein